MRETTIYMRTVPGKPNWRALTRPLPCDGQLIPIDFEWDGSSVPWIAQGLIPKHRHPVASCKHDFRCAKSTNKAERKIADGQFKEDVGRTSWKVTSWLGYAGVRIGAFLGIGNKF